MLNLTNQVKAFIKHLVHAKNRSGQRRQRSGIDTIKYHILSETPYKKVTKHK